MKTLYRIVIGFSFPVIAISATQPTTVFSFYLNIVLFGLSCFIGYYLYKQSQSLKYYKLKNKRSRIKNNKLLKAVKILKKRSEATEKDRAWLSGLQTFSTATFSKDGKLLETNRNFNQNFGMYFSSVDNYEDFIKEYFYKDKSLKQSDRVFRFKYDLSNEYFINSYINQNMGVRICEIFKFNVGELLELSERRKFELDNDRVNAYDILEEVIAKRMSFSSRPKNIMPKISTVEGLTLFTGEEVAERLFTNIYNVVSNIIDLKGFNKQVQIKLTRENDDFIIIARFNQMNLTELQLRKNLQKSTSNKNLIDLMNAIENVSTDLKIKSTLKNMSIAGEYSTELKVSISDLQSMKWFTKNYKRDHEATL